MKKLWMMVFVVASAACLDQQLDDEPELGEHESDLIWACTAEKDACNAQCADRYNFCYDTAYNETLEANCAARFRQCTMSCSLAYTTCRSAN